METIFYEKNLSWDLKTLKIVHKFFFLNFARFIFANAWIWRILWDLFSRTCEIIFLWDLFSWIWPKFAKIAKIGTAKISTIKVINVDYCAFFWNLNHDEITSPHSSVIFSISYTLLLCCDQRIFLEINPFSTNVPLMDKPGSWFLLTKC